MSYQTTEIVTIETGCQHELELELQCDWYRAEPDVGIMSDYIDRFDVIGVNGSTRHAKWVDKIVWSHNELPNEIIEKIYN